MTKGSPLFKTIRAQMARTPSLPSHYTFSILLLELLLEVIERQIAKTVEPRPRLASSVESRVKHANKQFLQVPGGFFRRANINFNARHATQQPDNPARQPLRACPAVASTRRRIGDADLDRLGNGERNLTEGEGRRGPSERVQASQPGQPLAQIVRLADIQHTLGSTSHEIHARPERNRAKKIVVQPLDERLGRVEKAELPSSHATISA